MSVLSTLALLMLPGALKAKPNREAELAGEIIGLKVDLADAKRERDALRHELERAWARHGEHPLQQIPAGPDFRPPHIVERHQAALQQAQQAHLAQQGQLSPYSQMAQDNAQIAQQHQAANLQQNLQYGLYGQGLMQGGQALNPELWCNCVPSRAQVWAADGAEA